MPAARVCLWNVQNYGTGGDAEYYGANSGLRNDFITAFVRDQRIDVLMLLESSVRSAASLQDLVNKLNAGPPPGGADWAVSLCGSALERGAQDPPANAGELAYRTDGRSEGYAVAWRTGQARFTVLPGLNPIATGTWADAGNPLAPVPSPLNLVTQGRPAETVDVYVHVPYSRKRPRGEPEYRSTGGYAPPGQFPYERGTLLNQWPRLDFATTGKYNPRELEWELVRRPAYVVMDLAVNGGTSAQRLCPVAGYHAPSRPEQAEWGSMIAGLSRELYVTNDLGVGGAPNPAVFVPVQRTVLGGDFNHEPVAWPGAYKYFTAPMGRADDRGAACGTTPSRRGPDTGRRTGLRLARSVWVNQRQQQVVINSASLDDYLYSAIDLAFFRDVSTTGERVNVPDLLMRNGNAYGAVLGAFQTHLANRAGNLAGNEQLAATGIRWWNGNAWKALYTSNYGNTFLSWANLLADLNGGQMTSARRAAEFYTIFISDHLPLVVELTY